MKKVGIIIFAVALIFGLVASNFFSFGRIGGNLFNFSMNFGGHHGSGKVASEIRNVSGFKAVDVGGVFQVEITAGKDFEVEVQADDNLLQHIRTEVRGGTLHIHTDGRLSTSNPLRIRISAPAIDDLDISGVANVTLTGVKTEELNVDASGASKITVSGETAKLNIDVSGATKVLADELKVVNATVEGSGASYVSVNVSGELRSDLSGASKVEYAGSPTSVNTKKSGGSRVTAK